MVPKVKLRAVEKHDLFEISSYFQNQTEVLTDSTCSKSLLNNSMRLSVSKTAI